MKPALTTYGPATGADAVVVVLHGGRADSTAPAPRGLAWARMLPFAWHTARNTSRTAVWLLRYRLRGWNGAAQDPVRDARWALSEARQRHPGAPIVLVGHSMGGRVALRLAGDPDVAGVCALAPWVVPGDPLPAGPVELLIVHGLRDRMTDPAASEAYAGRACAAFVAVPDEGHTMLRHPGYWHRAATDFVQQVLARRRAQAG